MMNYEIKIKKGREGRSDYFFEKRKSRKMEEKQREEILDL